MTAYTPPTIPQHTALRKYLKGSDGTPFFTTITYGPLTFPAAVSLSFQVEPVMDSANRMPKWWKHTFTIETVFDPTIPPESDSTGAWPVDLNMSQFRRVLCTPGLEFIIWNLGVGQNQRLDYSGLSDTGVDGASEPSLPSPTANSPSVNSLKQDPMISGGSVTKASANYSFKVDRYSDLNFGPRPQLLVCESIGGARVFRVVWTVEVALPNCCLYYDSGGNKLCLTPDWLNSSSGSYPHIHITSVEGTLLKVTEFNYSMSWSINESRFTTFSYVGSIEFAGTLISNTAAYANTGAVLDTKTVIKALGDAFTLRHGFTRTMQYDLSRDKRRLDFRVTDTEVPSDNAYYPGILKCNMNQSVEGNPVNGKWTANFSGDFEAQPGMPKYWGFIAFLVILQDRMRKLKFSLASEMRKQNGTGVTNYTPFLIPQGTRFSFQEDIFSRRTSFDFTFQFRASINNLLEYCRLFANTPTDWVLHGANMSPEMLKHSGTAEIRTVSHEPIINTCTWPDVAVDITRENYKDRQQQYYPYFTPVCPPKGSSITVFRNRVYVETNNHVVPMRPMSYLPRDYFQDLPKDSQSRLGQDLALTMADATLGVGVLGFFERVILAMKGQTDYVTSGTNDPGEIKEGTRTATYQSVGPSEFKIFMRGELASLCYDIRVPRLLEVQVMDREGVLKKETPMVVGTPYVVGPIVMNPMSATPLKLYHWEIEYRVRGVPVGPVLVGINDGTPGENKYDDILSRTDTLGIDGMNIGNPQPPGVGVLPQE